MAYQDPKRVLCCLPSRLLADAGDSPKMSYTRAAVIVASADVAPRLTVLAGSRLAAMSQARRGELDPFLSIQRHLASLMTRVLRAVSAVSLVGSPLFLLPSRWWPEGRRT